jgi:hypothetical protein
VTGPHAKTGTGWAWLLAIPVLCCAGHAVLVALGVGSLAAVVGGTTGAGALAAVGAVVVLAAAVAVVVRRRSRT